MGVRGFAGAGDYGVADEMAKSLWKHKDGRCYGRKSRKHIWVILYDMHLG
jgi:hypothetical protein